MVFDENGCLEPGCDQSNYYLIKFTRDLNLETVRLEMYKRKTEADYLGAIGKILKQDDVVTLENLSSKVDHFLGLYASQPQKYEDQAIELYKNLCFLFERMHQTQLSSGATEVSYEQKSLLAPITRMTEVVPLLSLNPFHTVRRMN